MKIQDAVSLVFTSQNKVFTIKRQNYLRSFPGYTAFPGGKVDEVDWQSKGDTRFANIPLHFLGAMVREAMEELGVNLLSDLAVENIHSLARAQSPDFNPTRFDTYFFRVHLSTPLEFKLDQGEFAHGQWLTASEVLDEWQRGERMMVPPVRQVFEQLQRNFQVEQIEFKTRYDLSTQVPHVESISGLWQVMPLSDTVPPADRTNCFIFGDKEKVLVDPAPRDEIEMQKFLSTISDIKPELIFLTHHHSDHHRNLTRLVQALKVPVALSQDSYQRICAKRGSEYFGGAEIKIIQHLQPVGTWKRQPVLAHHIPGHDEGQMGLAPQNLQWFIAGDLFQGIGTVVIGGEEGDMQKYFATLQYVIDLKPACVIPSHGVALGGTHILQKTLEHRKLREEQVLEMHSQGLNVDQMLERIYFNIPSVLLKYARANIESHLYKLKKEGRV